MQVVGDGMRRVGLTLAICGAVLAGCQTQNDALVDKTHIQVGGSGNEVFWLDADTLVFSGIDNGPEPSASSDAWYSQVAWDERKSHIFVWTIGQKPRIYRPDLWSTDAKIAFMHHVCAAKSKIYYSTSPIQDRRPDVLEWDGMAGALGGEKPVHLAYPTQDLGLFPRWIGNRDSSKIDRPCEQIRVPDMADHSWHPSWRGDALIDLGATSELKMGHAQPVLIHDLANGKTIPVQGTGPFSADDVLCIHAPMWENSFTISRCRPFDVAKREVVPVWKVTVDGRIERTDLDFTLLATNKPLPFRDGYFATPLATWNSDGTPNSLGEGVYVETETRWKRILGPGYEFRALAPDGCKAAFAVRSKVHSIILSHVEIYDLCKAAKN